MRNIFISILLLTSVVASAQEKAIINNSQSKFVKVYPVDMNSVSWTEGFWAERFDVCKTSMVPHMMGNYVDDEVSHAFKNFEIAAGLDKGEHIGPPFHDGDFYKMLEAEIVVYGKTNDPELKKEIDNIINVIAKSQREDGYIHTPTSIKEQQNPDQKHEFNERLNFETYNMGHLMTAACLHYRITGEKNLLNIAIGATDFLCNFYKRASEELAKNAICPSHYMGVTEMYRTVKDPKYLELAHQLIEIRNLVENGTDHNQDRIPFKQQTKAVGHAVRANYLYAGVADVYAEVGDDSLWTALNHIWNDVVYHKMYITGACGALYDGISPKGTSYSPLLIQQVHQAYGEDFELPNRTAHNESCANIGNLLWNYRMFLASGESKYIDVLETVAYNSLLAGVSLDGKGYFYTNPMAVSHTHGLSDSLRWSKTREPYISYCNCCPPNTIRTIAEMQDYAYSLSENAVWINLYGSSSFTGKLLNGKKVELLQSTNYPWDGNVKVEIEKLPKNTILKFRKPRWSETLIIKYNGIPIEADFHKGYVYVQKAWKKGDAIEIVMEMEPVLVASNPLVEANINQVAVQKGPIVYCLDGAFLPDGVEVADVVVPIDAAFESLAIDVDGNNFQALEGELLIIEKNEWKNQLYRPVKRKTVTKKIRLIPYYAWGNNGKADMRVWLPLSR